MSKILKNTIIKKIIIILTITMLLINTFPNVSQAASFLTAIGGVILDAVFDFLIFLGDTALNILQNNFISTDEIVIQASSDDCNDSVSALSILAVIVGVLMVIVSVVVAIVSWGTLSWASAAGVMAGIKFIGGVVLCTAAGSIIAVKGANDIIEALSGKFDLPQIRFTPYEIFSNQIPVFDINFISPMSSVYSEKVYDFEIGQGTTDKEMTANTDWINILSNAGKNGLSKDSFIFIGKIDHEGLPDFKEDIADEKIYDTAEGYKEYEGKYIKDLGLTSDVFSVTTRIIIEDGHNFSDWYKGGYLNFDDTFTTDEAKANYKSILKHYDESEYSHSVRVFWIHNGDIYSYEGADLGDNVTYIYVLPFNSNNDNVYTKYNQEKGVTETHFVEKEYKSSASLLQNGIATWYKVLRRVALIGLLSVLVYVGIRIILSATASDKAKYKKMFLNWLVAVCILFILHYLMVFILTISSKISEIFLKKGEPNIFVELPADTSIDGKALVGGKSGEAATEDDPPVWSCSFTGYLRLLAGAYGDSIGLNNFGYGIMYLIMVIYTIIFTFMYLRRVLYMAFLTMIAPLIALTYPLDKLKDGKAQALGLWLREYVFNALIQPIHLILYIMIVSNVMDYVEEHPVYAIVALGFLLPAEKFIRKLFGFEKPDTADDNIANMVGGAAVMNGVNKLSALDKPRPPHEDNRQNTVRTAENPTDMDVPEVNTNTQVREEENNRQFNNREFDNRTEIEAAYRNLLRQGMSNDDIRTNLNNQFNNAELVNEVMSSNGGMNVNFVDPGLSQEGNNATILNEQQNGFEIQSGNGMQNGNGTQNAERSSTVANNLRVPQITPPTIKRDDRNFASKVMSGFLNVGYAERKRSLKAQPLKKLGKYTGMAIGGATLGLIGLAAGISTGELDNTLKFTASGLGIGLSTGGTLGANVGEWTSEQKENFKKGYHGSEEYNNIRFDRNFLASEDLRNMINDREIHSEMSGGLVSEVHRTRAIAAEAQEYHKAGVTDSEQIKTCMKAGLTVEEGRYAIELAKTMKKGKVNTPRKVANYKSKYRRAFESQNDSPEKDRKIEDIWNTATRIRFK